MLNTITVHVIKYILPTPFAKLSSLTSFHKPRLSPHCLLSSQFFFSVHMNASIKRVGGLFMHANEVVYCLTAIQ